MPSETLPLQERTLPNIWAAAVASAPQSRFLSFMDTDYSYEQADRWVQATRQRLERDGVKPGDHVALFLDNCPEYIWILLGLASIGAVSVPIHAQAQGPMLRHFLTSSDCPAAIVAARYADRVAALFEPDLLLERVWIFETEASQATEHPRLARRQETLVLDQDADPDFESPHPTPRFRDTTLLMFTSGTSGPSKAAIVAQAHPVTAALAMADAAGITQDDCMHTCLPLSHANASWFTVYAAITKQASVALTERFSVRGFWRDIATSRATQTSLLGSMLQLLWKRDADDDERHHSLQSIFIVPFPNDPQAYEDRFSAKLQTVYGMSEWTPVALSRPGEGYDKPTGVAGPLRRDLNDIAILDDDDLPLPTGTIGEIAVRRKLPFTSFQGYYGREATTLQEWRNLWFHTGDHGYIGEDDYLYYVGRKSDSLRRRGENVSAGELEDILLQCPAVKEVAVVAVPSDLGDISEDDIAIFVIPARPDAAPGDIADYAGEHLPRFMRPRYVKFVPDLPRTDTEKILKAELRRTARASLDTFHDLDRVITR